MKKPKLSSAQIRVLQNLLYERRASHGFEGMAQMGGLHKVLWCLRRRGWLSPTNKLTKAGRVTARELDILITRTKRAVLRQH